MILNLITFTALLGAGAMAALKHYEFAASALALSFIVMLIKSYARAKVIQAAAHQTERCGRFVSNKKFITRFQELSEALRAVEWDREMRSAIARPLDQHPLVKELMQPAELRKFSNVELFQRVLTIVAGFTRATAAGVIFKTETGAAVVAYGVTGRRFEQHLRVLGEEFWRGNQSVLGTQDSFSHTSVWGGAGSFGHRFSLVIPFSVDENQKQALVWLGFAHGAGPTSAEAESAMQLLNTVSNSILATHKLVILGTRADTAEVEKTQTSQMLAQVSHDIRTPLSNVKAILHLLSEQNAVSPTEASELTKVALQNCEDLGELVGDVIDFTRAKAGQLAARKEPVELCALCTRLVSIFSVTASQRGLALTFDTQGLSRNDAWITGDAGHIKRAISNLISNALKYTQAGEVRVRIEDAPNDKQALRIVVQDTGLGMNDEQLAKLFTPFTRFHVEQAEGIGLGLAITKLFITEHHGRITVKSRVNEGSSFIIELARLSPKDSANHLQAVPAVVLAPRILLVDDDYDIGQSLARILNQHGCKARSVQTVVEACRLLNEHDFEAVVTDLNMPGGGGRAVLDTTHTARNSPAVVILSGSFDSSIVKELKARGALEVFEKPVEPATLVACLKDIAAQRQKVRLVRES